MKRCPKCNQVFDQEWLSFCTNDGTSLVDTSALPPEPPPTMMSPPLPPSVSPSEQPTINLQTGSSQPPPAARVLATKETGPRDCFADSRHLQHHRRLVLQPGCAHGSGRHCSGNCLAGADQK